MRVECVRRCREFIWVGELGDPVMEMGMGVGGKKEREKVGGKKGFK